jgi:putative ABC transport system substrate-binding protein
MRRREFISLLGSAAAAPLAPLAALAQQPAKVLRIGTVQLGPRNRPQMVAFEQRLRELGYVEGTNIAIDFIEANGQANQLEDSMRQLVQRRVDVILAPGPEIALKSAVVVTSTVPIVTIAIDYDIIAKGYVQSLARPGGNVTGIAALQIELTRKRLQLMKDAVPSMRGLSVFWDQNAADQWQVAQSVAASLDIKLFGIELRNPPYDYEAGLAIAPQEFRSAFFCCRRRSCFRIARELPKVLSSTRPPQCLFSVSMPPPAGYSLTGQV